MLIPPYPIILVQAFPVTLRFEMFSDKEFPLKTMYQFSKRVTLYKDGKKMKNSGMIAYAWFVWDRNYVGKPSIEWIL